MSEFREGWPCLLVKFKKWHTDFQEQFEKIISKNGFSSGKKSYVCKKSFMKITIDLKDKRIKENDLSISELVFAKVYETKKGEEIFTAFDEFEIQRDSIYRNYKRLNEKNVINYVADRGRDLYLIGDEQKSVLKIGMSNDCKGRFERLKCGNHLNLELLFVIEGKGNLESELLKKFSEFRLSGEWFKYDESIINYFKNEI